MISETSLKDPGRDKLVVDHEAYRHGRVPMDDDGIPLASLLGPRV